jgi:hypothetical protein
MQSEFDRVGFWGCVLSSILAAIGCSSPTGDTGSADASDGQVIGAQGGTVSRNGATLVIPAGALSSDVTFTVSELPPPPLNYVDSEGFSFEPAVSLAKPVSITIPLDVAAAPKAHVFWILPTNGLGDLGGVVSGRTITAEVSRLGYMFACDPGSRDESGCANSP